MDMGLTRRPDRDILGKLWTLGVNGSGVHETFAYPRLGVSLQCANAGVVVLVVVARHSRVQVHLVVGDLDRDEVRRVRIDHFVEQVGPGGGIEDVDRLHLIFGLDFSRGGVTETVVQGDRF